MKKLLLFSSLFFITAHLFAQLNANFNANTTQGCAPLDSIQFTDISTGNPTSWLWNFGNGNTSSLQNPQASYPLPGVYTVSLTVGDGTTSDTETKTGYISVYQIPVAHFTYTPPMPCTSSMVTFNDNSTLGDGPIVSWNWGFGDGSTQTVATSSVTHNYATPISAPVSVIITDSHGCQSDFDTLITIVQKPKVGFKANEFVGCSIPHTINFTDTSTIYGPATYSWNFGDGGTSTQQNPSHTYTALGTYNIKLVITQGGCSDSLTKWSYIYMLDYHTVFTMSDSVVCVGDTVFFNDLSFATGSLLWNFGDGSATSYYNPESHIYNSPGTYNVKLRTHSGYGCIDSLTKTITVLPLPVVSFTANDTASCSVPFTVNFTGNATGGTAWSWDFGDGGTSSLQNPSHTFLTQGSYTVTLIVTNQNGCKGTLVKTGYINIMPPIANFTFTPQEGCAPLTVNFNGSSSSSPFDPINSYKWNYGDGSAINTTAIPTSSHIYPNPGVYPVSLIVTTPQGCRDTLVSPDSVHVGFHVTPSFTISDDTVCYHQEITFTMNTPGATSWTWFFGDGGVDSTNQNPIYVYGDTGTFTVTLVACNNGCCDTLIVPYIITILPPKANFYLGASCAAPFTVICYNTSEGADSILWDFHDGSLVSNISPASHTYPTRGLKTVTLHAFNFATGCQDSMTINYTVTDPIARFKGVPLSGCYPLAVSFTDTSQDSYFKMWDFGDGSFLNTYSPVISHTYTLPGYYTVKEVINDIHSCKDSLTKPNYIHAYGPLPGFTVNVDTGCAPLSVIFQDSTVSEYPVVTYIWQYGDGSSDTLTTPTSSHIYANPGSYTVTLTIIDSQGCSSSLTIPNYIRPTLPVPAFAVDTFSCPGKVITFDASATLATGATFNWLFGDGGSLNTSANTATHTYNNNGVYTITLMVTDQNGCDSTVSHTITIDKPVAAFDTTVLYSCINTIVNFTNISTGINITSYLWNFGNGATSTITSPSNLYTNPGVFNVTLIATNSIGCSDTLQRDSLVVVNNPQGTFQFTPSYGCKPLTVTFTVSTQNIGALYTYDFGDGTNTTVSNNIVTHTYLNDIIAHPTVVIHTTLPNGIGCNNNAPSIGDSLVIVQTYGEAAIEVNGDTTVTSILLNPGQNIPLNAIINIGGSGNPQYTWSPSPGLSCTNCINPTLTGTGSGQSVYYHIYAVDGGCNAHDSILVTFAACMVNLYISAHGNSIGIELAAGDTVTLATILQSNGGGTPTYSWSPSAGLSCTDCPNPVLTGIGSGQNTYYYLEVTDGVCSARDSILIQFGLCRASLNISANGDTTIIELGQADTVTLSSTMQNMMGGNPVYTWSPPAGLSCTDCPVTILNGIDLTHDTWYYLTVVDGYCRALDSVLIKFLDCETHITYPNVFTPNDDSKNDYFYIEHPCPENFLLVIYNRWGQKIYETSDPVAKWDGRTFNGEYVPSGTYYWILSTREKSLKGFVELIREKRN